MKRLVRLGRLRGRAAKLGGVGLLAATVFGAVMAVARPAWAVWNPDAYGNPPGGSPPYCSGLHTPNPQPCAQSVPGISYSPSLVDFGYIDNNGGSSTQSITITNNSSQTVELTGVGSIFYFNAPSDSETGIYCTNAPSGSDTVQLAPGQSCTANVTLTFGDGQYVQDCYPANNTTCEYYYAPSFFVAPASNPNDSTGFYVPVEFVVGPPGGGPGIPTTPGPPSQQGGGSSTTPAPPSGPIQPATGCHQLPAGTVVAALPPRMGAGTGSWTRLARCPTAGTLPRCSGSCPRPRLRPSWRRQSPPAAWATGWSRPMGRSTPSGTPSTGAGPTPCPPPWPPRS